MLILFNEESGCCDAGAAEHCEVREHEGARAPRADYPVRAGCIVTVVRDLLLATTRHNSRTAVIADGREWSYAQLSETAMRLAGSLSALGITSGDPVAIALRNSAEYLVADLAISILGAAKVPINLMLADAEISYILRDSGARAVIVEQDCLAAVVEARAEQAAPIAIVRGAVTADAELSWDEQISGPVLSELPAVDDDDRALIMYTGGTTGRPKGVVHSQRGIVSNLLSHLIETEISAEDRLLVTSPLPHSSGFLAQTAMLRGATIYVEDKFDLEVVLDRIENDGASYLFMVPTMIYRLLDAIEQRESFDSSALCTILYGAAPITVERLEQGLRLLGPVFVQLFGQSEVPNFLTRLRRDDHAVDKHSQRLRSCGQRVLMAEVRTVRDDGSDCEIGEVGEVIGRAPYVMQGYLGLEPETQQALRDGWLHTGDLGYLDELGYLYLVDRKKDMIITGGLNVYSSEVEQVLASFDEVSEVAVVGIAHAEWGEAVVAFVVPSSEQVTEQRVLGAARAELTSYKRPKEVVLVDSIPVTAVGKVDKKQLRQEWTRW